MGCIVFHSITRVFFKVISVVAIRCNSPSALWMWPCWKKKVMLSVDGTAVPGAVLWQLEIICVVVLLWSLNNWAYGRLRDWKLFFWTSFFFPLDWHHRLWDTQDDSRNCPAVIVLWKTDFMFVLQPQHSKPGDQNWCNLLSPLICSIQWLHVIPGYQPLPWDNILRV